MVEFLSLGGQRACAVFELLALARQFRLSTRQFVAVSIQLFGLLGELGLEELGGGGSLFGRWAIGLAFRQFLFAAGQIVGLGFQFDGTAAQSRFALVEGRLALLIG